MAIRQLGKLKFRFKDGGIDFCWDDGEKRRIGLRRKNPNGPASDDYAAYDEGEEGYADGRYSDEDYADEDYDDRDYGDGDYDDDRGYDDRDYDDGDYDDRGYDDRDYDDGDYDDRGYDDRDYGDGDYDDRGYDDDGGYDDDYDDRDYDDRYSDEDADGGYPTGDYPENDDVDYASDGMSGLVQYVDENDWVTYVLLFLLPPLGIYLLWRRRRFDSTIRYALSATSAVWFVVLIVLLAMGIFGGNRDMTTNNNLPSLAPSIAPDVTAASPTPSVTPTVAPSATSSLVLNNLAPSATPITGGTAATVPAGSLVWASASGTYYHNNDTCTMIGSNETVTQVTVENATSRGKYACPVCYGGDTYYATARGSWYHLDKDCSDMVGAEVYSKERAEAAGKKPCPVCVTKTQQSLATQAPNSVLKLVTSSTTDQSGIKVWCTSGGKNYHMTSGCRGMTGATQVSLKDALLMGKTACSTCCAASGTLVYCTKGGTYYHRTSNCSGMSNATQVTLAEALVLGKRECGTCKPASGSAPSATATPVPGSSGSDGGSDEVYVYATTGGKYYHVKQNCSGMTSAKRVTLKSMLAEGRAACPECCSGASMTVYATKGGTYYHSYATCSNMSNAASGTLAQALAQGYKRCPKCWSASSGENADATNQGSSPATATSDTVMVYATKNGKWYHTKEHCSGMTGASHISLTVAMNAGKTACPTCASGANAVVYSTSGGKYYHKASTCTNMQGGKKRTLAEALKMGQTACPVCMKSGGSSGDSTTLEKVANFTVGKSGIKVYASPSEKYYHTKSNCSGKTGLSHVALETALNYGKTACPTCASTADTRVYATKNGKYYHASKSCAGSGAVSGTLANALAYGFDPCPYCVTGTSEKQPTSSGTYESGRSGIKVYATASGTYYHTSKSHAGSGAVKVTLETALNYGKKACPDCAAVADRTVYAVKGSFYYHASKSCAGSGAVKGTYAQALAYGLTACPNCIGGGSDGTPDSPAPTAGPTYSASEDSTVYVDLYSDHFYYHKSSKCSGAGMTDGTEVTLEYALDFGYKRCPYCNPPSSID